LLPWLANHSRSGFKADCTGGWASAMISMTGRAARATPIDSKSSNAAVEICPKKNLSVVVMRGENLRD
jgi:hypothetical protein